MSCKAPLLVLLAVLACSAPHAQTVPTSSFVGQSAEDIRSEFGEPLEVRNYEAGTEVYAADIEIWRYEPSEHETVMFTIREGVAFSEVTITAFDGLEDAIYHVATIATRMSEAGLAHELKLSGIDIERSQPSIVYRSFGLVGMHIREQVEIIEDAGGDGYQVQHTRFNIR